MASRKEFTDAQKAEIFCRDRATCAFIGKSLWILDHGATPFWETDWIEHVHPVSRGGKSTTENGVCASSTYNDLRGNNTRGKSYLFREGRVTDLCCYTFQAVPKVVLKQLRRFEKLLSSDWYFNRAVKDIMVACDARWKGAKNKRTWSYWIRASWRRLQKYRVLSAADASFEVRGLVGRDPPLDVRLMLKLRRALDLETVNSLARKIYEHYDVNCGLYDAILNESSARKRQAKLAAAKRSGRVSPIVITALESLPDSVLPVI